MKITDNKYTFMDYYEELNLIYSDITLTEARQEAIKLNDITGYIGGSSQPILRSYSDQKSLLDFIDKAATKDLNKDLPLEAAKFKKLFPEDANLWAVSPSDAARELRYVFTCTNPACQARTSMNAAQLYKRISGKAATSYLKKDRKYSAEQLLWCAACANNIRNKNDSVSATVSNTSKVTIINKKSLKSIPPSSGEDTLFTYLNIPYTKQKNKNTNLADIDPDNWPPFSSKYTLYYNCPNCGIAVPMPYDAIASKAHSAGGTATALDIAMCGVCSNRSKVHNDAETISEVSWMWDRLDKELLFEIAEAVPETVLPLTGIKWILEKNEKILTNISSEQSVLAKLKANFDDYLAGQNDQADSLTLPKIQLGALVSKTSKIILPWRCTNLDCCTANNGQSHYYEAPVYRVYNNIFHGCKKCEALSGIHTSESEKCLRKAIEYLFNVKHEPTEIVRPYKDIDVLFRINGKRFGIEYDGAYYHRDPDTIRADEAKVKLYSEKGINFLRIREYGCAKFDEKLLITKPLIIPKSLLALSDKNFISCLEHIYRTILETLGSSTDTTYFTEEQKTTLLNIKHNWNK